MPESNDLIAIEEAVKTYLDGLYEGNADKVSSVFHPQSILTWELDGELTPMGLTDWLKMLRDRQSPKSNGLPRQDKILGIELASPTMAFAKIWCAIPPSSFTDYLCFLKANDKWQVAQKISSTILAQ